MPEPAGTVFTDAAGVTCRYTPINEIKPGDVFIVGWRSTVERVERCGDHYRLFTEDFRAPATDWVAGDTTFPVEVSSDA